METIRECERIFRLTILGLIFGAIVGLPISKVASRNDTRIVVYPPPPLKNPVANNLFYPSGDGHSGPVSVSPIEDGVIGTAAILGMFTGFLLSLRGSWFVRKRLLGPGSNPV